jgi:hypothetical protein
MAHRLRWLVLGSLSLALCAWLAITFWLPSRERIPAVAAASALPLSDPEHSIDLADLERTVPERAVVPEEVPPDVLADRPHVLVRGSVLGPVPDLEKVQVGIFADCRVRAEHQPPHRPSLEVSVDRQGRFEADVTQLLEECPDSRDLLVVAKHRLSKSAIAHVEAPSVQVAEPGSAADRGPLVTEVTLTLELGALIQGRVTVGTAEPHAAVALLVRKLESFVEPVLDRTGAQRSAAQMWAFDEGLPPWTWVMETRERTLDADGEFELQVESGARYAVVAAVAGLRPQTALVDVLLETLYRADLTILPGEELSGTLQLGPDLAPEGTQLMVNLQGGDESIPTLRFEWGQMSWIDGGFEWSRSLAVTDASGHFAFRGLAPARYELSAIGEGIPRQYVRASKLGVFAAPDTGLHLGPCLARVELDLAPPQSGPVSFKLKPLDPRAPFDLGPFDTDPRGRATLHLKPQSSYDVVVAGRAVGRITTAGVGEISSWRAPP